MPNFKPVMKDYKKLTPFKFQILQSFPFIAEDFDSLTNYELLCKVVEYLNDVMNNENNVEENVTSLYNSFVELQDYVNNYFDNLDVQEEINNKLDEMSQDGTLEHLISEYILEGKNQVEYIFPNITNNTSEYSIIKTNEKTILIDCGLSEEYTNLKTTLDNNNISHIDYLFISHFHNDHVGGLISLYEDEYCDNETYLLLPTFNTSIWVDNSAYETYQEVISYINSNNIEYHTPIEGMHINIINNLDFYIYNTNDTYYVDNHINNDYNNASLIILCKHFDINSLFVGDCYKHSLNKIYNDGVLPYTIHLYKMGHHGNDDRDNSIIEFIRKLDIKNAVQIVGIYDLASSKCTKGGTASDINTLGIYPYISGYNKNNIKFVSLINTITLVDGFNQSGSDNLNFSNENVYVTPNSNLYQDGTQNYPFNNLTQALGYCNRNNGRNYHIHLAAGTYDVIGDRAYSVPVLYGITNTVTLEGTTGTNLMYGFKIYNCSNIVIKNINIINKMVSRGVTCDNSNVLFENVTYTKYEDLPEQYAFSINNSNVSFKNCTISKATFGIYEEYSNVYIDGLTFENILNQCIYGKLGVFKTTDNITVNDASVLQGRYSSSEKPIYEKGLVLFENNNGHKYSDGQINDLKARPGRFNEIEIIYGINTYKNTKIFDMRTETVQVCGINDIFVANDGNNYMYSLACNIGDRYYIEFNYSRKSTENRSDNTISFENGVDTFSIYKIIAH